MPAFRPERKLEFHIVVGKRNIYMRVDSGKRLG